MFRIYYRRSRRNEYCKKIIPIDAPPDGYTFVYSNGQQVFVNNLQTPLIVPIGYSNS